VAVAVLNHQTNFPAATSTRAAATTWWRGDGVHTQKRDDNSRSHVVVVAVRNYLNNTVSDVIQDENILPVVAKNSVRIDVVAMKLPLL
jgi:hypothetical protein